MTKFSNTQLELMNKEKLHPHDLIVILGSISVTIVTIVFVILGVIK